MNFEIVPHINLINVTVLLTFIYALFNLNRNVKVNVYLLIILLSGLLSEMSIIILKNFNTKTTYVHFIVNFFFHTFWLLILNIYATKKKLLLYLTYFYILFFIVNFIIIYNSNIYNFNSFVLGSIIYTLFFIKENYRQMKAESIEFFINDSYLLIFSPLMFMLGLSLILSFAKAEILRAEIFWGITLYKLFVNLACLVYYSLINIYVYRQKNQIKHG
jgi:hypothetical protein